VRNVLGTSKPSLAIYSSWLASYDGAAQLVGRGIEVPGAWARYATAFERPRVAAHPTIVCFNPSLLLMSSKQAPKRIGALLSDGESKHFLVKGGEDVRQDQRIQR
jgi:DNA-dependent protein kinase catalytic subunit